MQRKTRPISSSKHDLRWVKRDPTRAPVSNLRSSTRFFGTQIGDDFWPGKLIKNIENLPAHTTLNKNTIFF